MLLSSLLAIAAVLIMGVMSPGPSFIYVARTAVVHSRAHGLVTALGTGAGAATFALMAMLGLQKVLNAVPELFIGLKLAGGAYLIWIGIKIFRGARQPMAIAVGEKRSLFHCGRRFAMGCSPSSATRKRLLFLPQFSLRCCPRIFLPCFIT